MRLPRVEHWTPLIILVGLALAYAAVRGARLRLNFTSSLPVGVYRLVDAPLRRGSLIVVCPRRSLGRLALQHGFLQQGVCPSGTRPMLKIAAAIGGDTVELTEQGARVNGRLLTFSAPRERDQNGHVLAGAPFGVYDIEANEVWLHNPKPDSWDSRYFGPVSLEGTRFSVARPVMTFVRRPSDGGRE